MIDPQNIVRYDYTDDGLEELLIFCVCVAGKSAKTIAPRVHDLCNMIYEEELSPFDTIKVYRRALDQSLKELGIGCYNQKSNTIWELILAGLDLRTCSVSDLEAIKGIGPKTARFFVMSSREGAQHAALDTHLLKWLRAQGIDAPKSTPTGKKYLDLEQKFIKMVPEGMTPAEFDLKIWKEHSK